MNTRERSNLFLPVEILLQILFYLDAKELMLLSIASKELNELVNDPIIWKQLYHNVKKPLYDIVDYKNAYKKIYPHIDKYKMGQELANNLTQIIPTIIDPLGVGNFLKQLAAPYHHKKEHMLYAAVILYKRIIEESFANHFASTHYRSFFFSTKINKKENNTTKVLNQFLAAFHCEPLSNVSSSSEVNHLEDLKFYFKKYPDKFNKEEPKWMSKIISVQASFLRKRGLAHELNVVEHGQPRQRR